MRCCCDINYLLLWCVRGEHIYINLKDYLMEQTTVELFAIYKTLLELLDDCRNNQHLAKFSDELEKLISDFEEFYPEIVSEYHFVNK